MLPLLIFSGVLLWEFAEAERRTIQLRVTERTNHTALIVEQELDKALLLLEGLATSPYLEQGNLGAFYQQSKYLVASDDQWLILFNAERDQLINTLRPFGSPLPQAMNAPAVEAVLKTGRPAVMDLLVGAVAQRPVVAIGFPIKRGGKISHVLALTFHADRFSKLLNMNDWPASWTAAVIDRTGTIVARNRAPERFVGNKAVPHLVEKILAGYEGEVYVPTLEGAPAYGMVRRVPASGWSVIVGAPLNALEEPLRTSVLILTGGGLFFVLIAIVFGVLTASAIAAPIHKVAEEAATLGRGEMPQPVLTGISELRAVSNEMTKAAKQLSEREARLKLLLSEVDHRARNVLAIMQSMIRLTRSSNTEDYARSLEGRVAALARAHSLLAASRWQGARLEQIISEEFAPYAETDQDRMTFVGDPVELKPEAAQVIAMAIHELATNSIKYGAMAHPPTGKISVRWKASSSEGLLVEWRETGVPLVQKPTKEGFGSRMIRTGIAGQLHGQVSVQYSDHGLAVDIQVPPDALVEVPQH